MKTKTTNNQFAAAQKAAEKKAEQANTVDQLEIARKAKEILGGEFTIDQIQRIVAAEQQACGEYLSRGAKIVKWNYMTLYPSVKPARKLKCPKNGITYDVNPSIRIICRIGEGLRRAVQNQTAADTTDASRDAQKLVPLPRKPSGREKLYAERYVGGGIQDGQEGAKIAGVGGKRSARG